MEIRADLLLDNLKDIFSVSCYGRLTEAPLLRPVFYQNGSEVEKNRIYIVRPSSLPPRHLLDSSNLLICTEGMPSLAYQHSGFPLFIIQKETAMAVFNEILSIFERYDVWEKALISAVKTNADISELVQLTAPLILNDITVIDKDLRVIAAANYEITPGGGIKVVQPTKLYEPMPVHLIHQYKKGIEDNQSKRGAYFADQGCYCINLHQGEHYLGNISLFPRVSNLRKSDPYVMDILAKYVLEVFRIQSSQIQEHTESYEKFVRNILDGKKISQDQFELLTHEDLQTAYHGSLCFCIPLPDTLRHFTAESICQTLLKNFDHLLVFPYQSNVVGIYGLTKGTGDPNGFANALTNILEQLDLRAGISNPLYDIRKMRFFYDQTLWALEFMGTGKHAKRVAFFSDYTLHYLMMNSTGSFPAEYLCPPGLLQLREYDKGSNVDYWETLRCFLDEQMNLAQTSKILGIHRNTLIQRIERIYNILGTDLKDPMLRLWMRMAIYLFDEETTN